MQHTSYDYLLFDLTLVVAALRFRKSVSQPDAYLADDADGQLAALHTALAAGYRWVRTEGEFAVLERAHNTLRLPST